MAKKLKNYRVILVNHEKVRTKRCDVRSCTGETGALRVANYLYGKDGWEASLAQLRTTKD